MGICEWYEPMQIPIFVLDFLTLLLKVLIFLTLCLYKLEIITLSLFLSSVSETSTAIALAWCRRARGESAATIARPAAE